ncbi:MAG: hypothetical protein ACREMN_09075, partial [Gemmatimonadales bacterium]
AIFAPPPPPAASAPPGGAESPPVPPPEPVSVALTTRRDSALAARDRAIRAGALKNNVPAMILAEGMLQAADRALQEGDQSRAYTGYVGVVVQYGRARGEARALERDAQRTVQRVIPLVQAIPAGAAAANAGVFLARAESLLRQQDYTLAKVAAQSAEEIGVQAGIAPASSQPPNTRAALEVLLTDLGRALASERIGNIRVLYPGLTDDEGRRWEAFFQAWDQIAARFTIEQLATRGATANADVRATFEYVPSQGGVPRVDRRRFAMRFERRDEGWRLAGVNELQQ